ncbi:MAG TPA: PQQ-binding-like beta-propeller repeat protein, partial [Gammaproteobacteria bacterium]|nr:PQQ-binding-like beta-propeller repeat protein [Gammaproteobacteria bacterium]
GAQFIPVTDEMLADPDPADWLMWRRTQNSWGYSPLDAIDRGNVGNLTLVWSRDLEPAPSQESIPLVYDGVMYVPNPLDVTQAVHADTGELIWEHRRDLPDDLGRYVPFPQTNRNLAIYDRLIIDNGSDDFVYALDAESGKLVWETRILDYRTHPAKQGSAPLVAGGRLISGRQCQPQSGPDACIITAHDALTGRELWRKRTIPRPGEPGGDSWGDIPDDGRWHVGAWMIPSFDAQLDMLYIGTSVTAPAPKFMLAGNDLQYLYHNSTLALDPDTGETLWYYQHLVDHWDLDHPFERMLLDAQVAPDADAVPWINPRVVPGERRPVVTGIPGKTGIVYTLDRETGEFLWARPTIRQNVVSTIDGATGAVTVDPQRQFTAASQQMLVCPNANGGKNWPAGAYSPDSRLMYFGLQNTCMAVSSIADEAAPELVYAFDTSDSGLAPGAENLGTYVAIDVDTGVTKWQLDQRAGVGAVLATAGDLIFSGDFSGDFRAIDATSGQVLWETDLQASVSGHPITFSVDGRQYVAVTTGSSVLTNALSRFVPDERAATSTSRLFVFALPD